MDAGGVIAGTFSRLVEQEYRCLFTMVMDPPQLPHLTSPGYQEGILKAVVDESYRSENLVAGIYDEDFPEINTWGFKDWESEMKGWLAQ